MSEWKEKVIRGMKKRLGIGKQAISSDDTDAIDKLKEKIRVAESNHEKMKGINAIVRDKKLSEAEKIAKIQADYGYDSKTAAGNSLACWFG